MGREKVKEICQRDRQRERTERCSDRNTKREIRSKESQKEIKDMLVSHLGKMMSQYLLEHLRSETRIDMQVGTSKDREIFNVCMRPYIVGVRMRMKRQQRDSEAERKIDIIGNIKKQRDRKKEKQKKREKKRL